MNGKITHNLMAGLIFLSFILFSSTIMAAEDITPTVHQHSHESERQQGELVMSKLADNVYLHQSYMNVGNFGLVESNGLVVVQNKQAYIVDTPWTDTDTAQLLDWINQQGFEAIASISTHSHQDRTGGIGYLNQHGVKTVVSETTQHILILADLKAAQETFDTHEYSLVPGLVEVFDIGAGHTRDNLVVWLPQQKILFGGCLVKSLETKTMGYTLESDMQAWPLTVKQVMHQFSDAEMVVPGHGKVGDMSLLNHTIELIEQHQNQQQH
ncbi:DIM/SIM/IMP family subclass B1 metallo-beta-lactamase [Shewanella gaetbuli]